jgi:5'-AMP-activated protein kinase catalytic alpha subunit
LLDDSNCVKIIDFGFSSKTEKQLGSFCGTPPYMAPEIVSRKIYEGKGTDIWSIGVILYVMLYGFFPFRSSQETELFRLIQQGKIQHN